MIQCTTTVQRQTTLPPCFLLTTMPTKDQKKTWYSEPPLLVSYCLFNVFLRGSFLAVCVRIWLLCLSCTSFWYQFMPSSFFLLYHLCTVVILIKNTPSLFGISLDDLNKWPPGRKNNFPLGIYCNKLNTQNTI